MGINESSTRDSRPLLPGGVAATRRSIRRRGGFMGIGVAAALWLTGVVLSWFLPGAIGGAFSFLTMVMALPVMPILGMPAAGGGQRLLLAVALSAVIWWFIGQTVAARVSKRPVVGWREWAKEFVVLGLGLWIGAAGALMIGALALGGL